MSALYIDRIFNDIMTIKSILSYNSTKKPVKYGDVLKVYNDIQVGDMMKISFLNNGRFFATQKEKELEFVNGFKFVHSMLLLRVEGESQGRSKFRIMWSTVAEENYRHLIFVPIKNIYKTDI